MLGAKPVNGSGYNSGTHKELIDHPVVGVENNVKDNRHYRGADDRRHEINCPQQLPSLQGTVENDSQYKGQRDRDDQFTAGIDKGVDHRLPEILIPE
ncbi:hypothetical protein D3C75_944510 [compost metagenome]